MFLNKLRSLISRQSLKLKLTAFFVFIFGVTTILFNITVFMYMIRALEDDYDVALYNYAVDVSDAIALTDSTSAELSPLILDQGKILPFPLGNAVIFVRDTKGKILSRTGGLQDFTPPFERDFRKLANGEEVSYRTITYSSDEADSYRLISLPVDEKKLYYLQIAAPLTLLETQIDKRFDLLKYGIPIVLLIAAWLGFLLASRALRPIREIIKSTNMMSPSDLSKRVPVPDTQDEITQLGSTINEMLARIEQAFQSQEKFIADASHQLQTPLTILKGEIEQALRKNKLEPVVTETLQSSLQEVDKLSKIVYDMLLLARIDAGVSSAQKEKVFLDEILVQVVSRLQKNADQKQIRLNVNFLNENLRCEAHADADLIAHAYFNIIENAIKYSPPNSIIHIFLQWTEQGTSFKIQDQGPGLSANFSSHAFERFSRDAKTAHVIGGFGLGLAIAQRIVRIHDSELVFKNIHPQGAEFQFEIKNF